MFPPLDPNARDLYTTDDAVSGLSNADCEMLKSKRDGEARQRLLAQESWVKQRKRFNRLKSYERQRPSDFLKRLPPDSEGEQIKALTTSRVATAAFSSSSPRPGGMADDGLKPPLKLPPIKAPADRAEVAILTERRPTLETSQLLKSARPDSAGAPRKGSDRKTEAWRRDEESCKAPLTTRESSRSSRSHSSTKGRRRLHTHRQSEAKVGHVVFGNECLRQTEVTHPKFRHDPRLYRLRDIHAAIDETEGPHLSPI